MKTALPATTVKIGGFEHVSSVLVGGGHPVAIQTMWKDSLSKEALEGSSGKEILDRIERLSNMGCRILRFAVPNLEAAEALGELSRRTAMPLVADIHFDYRIALRCLEYPIAKIRINPGNIGSREKAKAVMDRAAERGRPIRIGINAGSLPKELALAVDAATMTRAEALVAAAEQELAWCDAEGFKDVLLSMKASDIAETLAANRLIASKRPVPLHLGVTEAGPLIPGIVRNTVAMTLLLSEGIGSTIRVSLSDTMESEVMAAREILSAVCELRGEQAQNRGVTIVSCPRCGRNSFDTHAFAQRWQERLYAMDKNITVAFMGCAVNGPGEARHADLGITGMGDKVLIFAHGEVVRTVEGSMADQAFEEELAKL